MIWMMCVPDHICTWLLRGSSACVALNAPQSAQEQIYEVELDVKTGWVAKKDYK